MQEFEDGNRNLLQFTMGVLQFATAFCVLHFATATYYILRQLWKSLVITFYDRFITIYDSYYNLRQVYYNLRQVIQFTTITTICDSTYDLGDIAFYVKEV